ncbi:Cyclin-dependent kinase 20 [Echinococcus granulosus]|nr:Cyclin-dependent kinase 20 [Echinococcus granulosus]
MDKYAVVSLIGEGAHGVVLKGRHKDSGELVALKKIPLRKLEEGIPHTAIREIKALQLMSSHPNIVRLREVFPHGMGFTLVFDYMVTDLSEILRSIESPLCEGKIKAYMVMLLSGVGFLHSNSIMHRDLKPANLLIDSKGVLKIADFGLARLFLSSENKLYSHQVATRWYRAPELLYGAKRYTESVDLWAVGCILGELLNNSPLFPGDNDIEQLWFVIRVLGTPTEKNWPGLTQLPDYNKISFTPCEPVALEDVVLSASPLALNLLKKFLCYDQSSRISAQKALLHDFFLTEPLPADHRELPKPSTRRSVATTLESCLKAPLSTLLPPATFFDEAAEYLHHLDNPDPQN